VNKESEDISESRWDQEYIVPEHMVVRIMLRYKTGGKVRTDAYTSSCRVGTGKPFSGIKWTEREPGHSSVVSILKIY
jgi:hypothetical protein